MLELVDRDYIKNMLLAWGKALSENPNAELDIQIDMIRQFYNSVSDLQTIEAEPVRHGHWIWLEPYGAHFTRRRKCSECGDIKAQEASNFCPNCGAKNGC